MQQREKQMRRYYFAGADAYKVNKITTVKKVFKELLEEKEV